MMSARKRRTRGTPCGLRCDVTDPTVDRRPRAGRASARAARAALATATAAVLPLVGVAALARFGPALATWVDGAPAWAVAGSVIGVGSVLCGLALMPTHAVSLAAGYALGPVLGTLAALASATLGSLVGYAAGRAVAGPGLVDRLTDSPRSRAVYAALAQASPARTAALVALLRLSPLAPFAATNVALAAVGVPPGPYVAGAALGLAPRVAAVAAFGATLAELDWTSPRAPWLLALGTVATVAAVAVSARLAAVALRRATDDGSDPVQSAGRVPLTAVAQPKNSACSATDIPSRRSAAAKSPTSPNARV